MPSPDVTSFFDEAPHTITHVVKDPGSSRVAVIDSFWDCDSRSGRTSTQSADKTVAHVRDNGLPAEWLLESHIHADHLTAALYLKERLGGLIGVGSRIGEVQDTWNSVFNYKEGLETDPSVFNRLLEDGDIIEVGS